MLAVAPAKAVSGIPRWPPANVAVPAQRRHSACIVARMAAHKLAVLETAGITSSKEDVNKHACTGWQACAADEPTDFVRHGIAMQPADGAKAPMELLKNNVQEQCVKRMHDAAQ